MNAKKAGLYGASDFQSRGLRNEDAATGASTLANQSAGVAAICALALDAAAYGDCGSADPSEVAAAASRLMFKCHDDLAAAVAMMG